MKNGSLKQSLEAQRKKKTPGREKEKKRVNITDMSANENHKQKPHLQNHTASITSSTQRCKNLNVSNIQ